MKKILFLLLTLCSFTTQAQCDISWSSPSAISTPLTDALDPRVVIDSNGNATAIWIEAGVLKASSLPFGGSWSAPSTISSVLNTASHPRLGVDSSGNVTALWVENTLINSAAKPFAGSWGSATTVSGSGADNPSLAVASSGNAVAVWTRSGFIESSTKISGTWSLVATLSGSGAVNPTVAISNFGTAVAAWKTTSGGSDIIVTDTLTISSNTWAATKNVFPASAAFSHDYPKVTMDTNGNASIAWFRFGFQNNAYLNVQLLTATLTTTGSAWGSGTTLSDIGIRNPADLNVKIEYDAVGNLIAVWTNSYDGESFVPESARRQVGASWSFPVQPQPPSIYSFGIDVAVSGNTTLLTNMVWDEFSTIYIVSQESDTTNPVLQGWTATTTLSSGDENGYPRCALTVSSSSLDAVAVWIHNDGTNNVIVAATGSDAVVEPPSNVAASQSVTNFGVYSDFYNTVTWDASLDPDIIQYDIYRNGVYFLSVTPDVLQIVDHNAVEDANVIYGVATLTSSFRQSSIINYTLIP